MESQLSSASVVGLQGPAARLSQGANSAGQGSPGGARNLGRGGWEGGFSIFWGALAFCSFFFFFFWGGGGGGEGL